MRYRRERLVNQVRNEVAYLRANEDWDRVVFTRRAKVRAKDTPSSKNQGPASQEHFRNLLIPIVNGNFSDHSFALIPSVWVNDMYLGVFKVDHLCAPGKCSTIGDGVLSWYQFLLTSTVFCGRHRRLVGSSSKLERVSHYEMGGYLL